MPESGFSSSSLLASRPRPSRDDEVAFRRKAEAYFYTSPGHKMSLPFGRPPGMTAEELDDFAPRVERLRPRAMYVLRRYEHPVYGDLFEAVVGPDRATKQPRRSQRLFAAQIGDDMRIVSRYVASFPFEGPTTRGSTWAAHPSTNLALPRRPWSWCRSTTARTSR